MTSRARPPEWGVGSWASRWLLPSRRARSRRGASNRDKQLGQATKVPDDLAVGASVSRGRPARNRLLLRRDPAHPHLALVEIIGGLPGGQDHGVDLDQFFLDSADSDTVSTVTFNQDGSPPVVSG
jgi:hypothetical protein